MKLKSRLFVGYLCIVILYSALTLLPPPSAATMAQFHATAGSLRVAAAILVLVVVSIWFVGFYSYAKFRHYAKLIQGTEDGRSVGQLGAGLLFLALWGPVASLTASTLNILTLKHVVSSQVATITNHYVGLLLPLASYICISLGAHGLSLLARQRPSLRATAVLNLILIYVSVIYIRLVFTAPHRHAVYQESGWLVLLTLVAPYIFMWSIGAVAAYELFLYSRRSPGFVYRKLWRLLAVGFGWLIVGSVALQCETTLAFRFQQSLHATLLGIYSLLALISIGFVLIALGAAKLQRIEEA